MTIALAGEAVAWFRKAGKLARAPGNRTSFREQVLVLLEELGLQLEQGTVSDSRRALNRLGTFLESEDEGVF